MISQQRAAGRSSRLAVLGAISLCLLFSSSTVWHYEAQAQVTDTALLAPVTAGQQLTVIHGYNDPLPAETCVIGSSSDHCDNQQYGLDLRPSNLTETSIIAPLPGEIAWISGDCLGIQTRDNLNLSVCHFSHFNVVVGEPIERGDVLGIRSTSWIHISLDDRYRDPSRPGVPFNGAHTIEGLAFEPPANEATDRDIHNGQSFHSTNSPPNPTAAATHVYVLRGGNQASDNAVINALADAGFHVTSGVETPAWNGTQAVLEDFDVVVVLYNQNWAQGLSPAGMRALSSYLRNGGGMVTGEWFIWRGSSELTEFLPARNCGWNYVTTTTYTQDTPDGVINAGIPDNFTFPLGNFAGTESCFEAMPDATTFYRSSNGGGRAASPGLTGWTIQLGRIASFSTLLSATELSNTVYRKLFTNTVSWAGIAGSAELFVRKRATRLTSSPGDVNSYTLRFTNTTTQTLNVKVITDTLPLDFNYQMGTTTGLTTRDPQVTMSPETGTQQLVWKGSFDVAGTQSISLTFDIRIAANAEVGSYYNTATAEAARGTASVAVLPATNVAPVRISLATELTVKVGGNSVPLPPDGNIPAIPAQRGKALSISARLQCPAPFASKPERALLVHNGQQYTMVEDPPSSGIYAATIPAGRVANSVLTIEITCRDPNDPTVTRVLSNPLPSPRLYDPSGVIADAVTGAPIKGATVTLYRVPGAQPDTSSQQRDCRIVSTRPTGEKEPWGGLDDHSPSGIDERIDASFEPAEIDPPLNPQTTNAEGRYGWNVVQGCWYLVVEATGYARRISPLVGVPPEVTDLDLLLTPTNRKIFLPIVR